MISSVVGAEWVLLQLTYLHLSNFLHSLTLELLDTLVIYKVIKIAVLTIHKRLVESSTLELIKNCL